MVTTQTPNGTAQPTKQAVLDPATALFERKLKLADQFSCRSLLVELETVDAELADLFGQIERVNLKLKASTAQAEEHATLLTIGVEGKNEQERKENRAKLVHQDTAHGAMLAAIGAIEAERAGLLERHEAAKRAAKRIELTVQYRTEVLRFLGG